jgi:hypothetical protein
MKIFNREPTLWLAVISSLIVVAGTFGLHWLNGQQAGFLVAAINGVAAAINAYAVRPISPTTFTYAIGAVVALAASYGMNVTNEQLAMINGTVVPILALLSRGQVSPLDTAISRTTTPDEKAVAEAGTGAPPSATVA